MTIKCLSIGMGWLRKHGDWCLFLGVAAVVTLWAIWFLRQPLSERRFSFAPDEFSPPLELTLPELEQHNDQMRRRVSRLLAESKDVRSAKPGTPAAEFLDKAVQHIEHGSYVDEFIAMGMVRKRGEPFTPYQEELVRLGAKVDEAMRLRNVESFLQASMAAAGEPEDYEGFYTDLWSHEMIVRKVGNEYQVSIGGGYWPAYNASWVDFSAPRRAGMLVAHYLAPDLSDKEYVDCTVKFDRGLAVVDASGPWRTVCVAGRYVKIGTFKPYRSEVSATPELGGAACSMDSWRARKELLEKGVNWVSPGRTGLCPNPEQTVMICEKYLGTYYEPKKN
jgi:hypothetical protein